LRKETVHPLEYAKIGLEQDERFDFSVGLFSGSRSNGISLPSQASEMAAPAAALPARRWPLPFRRTSYWQ
jgi:hypothetical protein